MCPRPCTAAETWAGPTWRGARHYSPLAVYAQSKLALTMFTRSFAEANSGHLSALSVHPGVIATKLLRVYHRVGRPASEGAAILACAQLARVHHRQRGLLQRNGPGSRCGVGGQRARPHPIAEAQHPTHPKTLTGFRHWMSAPRWWLT